MSDSKHGDDIVVLMDSPTIKALHFTNSGEVVVAMHPTEEALPARLKEAIVSTGAVYLVDEYISTDGDEASQMMVFSRANA